MEVSHTEQSTATRQVRDNTGATLKATFSAAESDVSA
jgi:hypothetical protein